MRGNHMHLGRQDYVPPAPITGEQLALVQACTVVPRHPERTKLLNWHRVLAGGVEIGMVATRMAGQCVFVEEWGEGMAVAKDWLQSEPPHARAILWLLRNQNAMKASEGA